MRYKPRIFTGQVLLCVFHKYVIIYQKIWEKGVVRPHLVESTFCKALWPLKGATILHHFLHKNVFSSWSYIKENFKNNETYQHFCGERAVRSPGKRGNVILIHPMG